MRLHPRIQVRARSHEIWDGEAGLEKEIERRSQSREKKRLKKYAKEVQGKNVRKSVSSLALLKHLLRAFKA